MGQENSLPEADPVYDPRIHGPWPYSTQLRYYRIVGNPIRSLPVELPYVMWELLAQDVDMRPFNMNHPLCVVRAFSTSWFRGGPGPGPGPGPDQIPCYVMCLVDVMTGWIIVMGRMHSDSEAHRGDGAAGHLPALRLPRSALVPAMWAEAVRAMRAHNPDRVGANPMPRWVVMLLSGTEDQPMKNLVDRLVAASQAWLETRTIFPISQQFAETGSWPEDEGWHERPIGMVDEDRPTVMEMLQRHQPAGGLCTVLLNEDDDFGGAVPLLVGWFRRDDRRIYCLQIQLIHEDDHPHADEIEGLRIAWQRANPVVRPQLPVPTFPGEAGNSVGGPATGGSSL